MGQYVSFCKVLNAQTKEYGYTEEAIRETIRICKDKNVLRDYLEEREKEVTGIMIALFDEEYIQKAYIKEKYDEGINEGKIEGKIEQAKITAFNLHAAGMTNSVIAKMIGYAENVVAGWLEKAEA